MSDCPIVIVESPYAGDSPEVLRRNATYLHRALRDSLLRGEAPFASHGLYTLPGVLDDTDSTERALGMSAGFAFGRVADRVAVYADLGVSAGMRAGIDSALARGVDVVWRLLDPPTGEGGCVQGGG